MKEIIFATGNPNKIKEVKAMLGKKFNILGLHDIGCFEDVPETRKTIEGNALQKARFIKKHYGVDSFSEDTGLEIESLNGEPGVYSARYAGKERSDEANMKLVLKKLKNKKNRKARFKTVIALLINGEEHLFEGIVNGTIGFEKKGTEGFGYDPIFIPDGTKKTFAQMGLKEKNKISHRKRAVKKLIKQLKIMN